MLKIKQQQTREISCTACKTIRTGSDIDDSELVDGTRRMQHVLDGVYNDSLYNQMAAA